MRGHSILWTVKNVPDKKQFGIIYWAHITNNNIGVTIQFHTYWHTLVLYTTEYRFNLNMEYRCIYNELKYKWIQNQLNKILWKYYKVEQYNS